MILYRIRFELCSALVTPLKGDTIWGHLVWGIANHEGEAAAAEFLEQETASPPALVLSSAFPADMLCRPLPEPKERTENLTVDKYSEIKKNKKIKYVPASDYFAGIETAEGFSESPLKSAAVTHNTIDRGTNAVLEGGLYTTDESWPGIMTGNVYKNVDWDLYVLSSLDKERIRRLIDWTFENGYGADASVGRGKIRIKSDPLPVTPKGKGNTYMALGPFVNPPGSGFSGLRADIFVRSGKIGGAFAAALSPYKKPVALYDEGAVFKSEIPVEYAGVLLQNMHGEDKRICQSGFAPVIAVEQEHVYG